MVILLLAASCTPGDYQVSTRLTPPEVSFLFPEEDQRLPVGEPLRAEVAVREADAPGSVGLVWKLDGIPLACEEGLASFDTADAYLAGCDVPVEPLAPGATVVLEVEARDAHGALGEALVRFRMSATPAPVVTVLSPAEEATYAVDAGITFQGRVTSASVPVQDLTAWWESDLDGRLFDVALDDGGATVRSGSLEAPGTHLLCLNAADPEGGLGYDCVQVEVSLAGVPPTCSMLSPADGATGMEGVSLSFEALVGDEDGAPDAVEVTWESSKDGLFGSSRPSSEGRAFFTYDGLTVGTHVLTVVGEDDQGLLCSDSIRYTVGGGPLVDIVSPAEGEILALGAATWFEATVDDTEDACDQLRILWTSSLDGELDAGDATVSGSSCEVGFGISSLSEGVHDVTLQVWDSDGFWNTDRIPIEVSACLTTWYPDLDGDGYGESGEGTSACTAPAGHVSTGGDCDDNDPGTFPGQAETCNGWDDNCNGDVDEGYPATTWYRDADGDGFGDASLTQEICAAAVPAGWVTNDGDCDDDNPNAWPGEAETCDGADNDCDGTVDEGFTWPGNPEWYRDGDGDGYGVPGASTRSCEAPDGYVDNARDCDDTREDVNPSTTEACDGLDNDCDGMVDEADAVDATTWYEDADGDGYGRTDSALVACAASGYSATGGDCDDGDSSRNPGVLEACNSQDDDCDGNVDETFAWPGRTTWYRDADGDGFGTTSATTLACEPVPGYVLDGMDCDDARADVNPSAPERCDGVDDDCDGVVDEPDAIGALLWYRDGDADGFGWSEDGVVACTLAGHVTDGGDCDDTNSGVWPGAPESCDDLDNDCDGVVDDGMPFPASTRWYKDSDGDGFGTGSVEDVGCEPPVGYVAVAGDCDDTVSAVRPGAGETCDGVDNDCDGVTDEPDALDAVTWYLDDDMDGYGRDDTTQVACSASGYASRGGDCDDADPGAHPGGVEVCNGRDDDCLGGSDDPFSYPADTAWYLDADGDGYGSAGAPTAGCEPVAGYVLDGTDCDDTEAGVNPGAGEVCDTVDNDCDGTVNGPSALDARDVYQDLDRDGYGTEDTLTTACPQPGWVVLPGDCDDGDADSHPAALETCDGGDDDCDGLVDEAYSYPFGTTWYQDGDGDGFGTPGSPLPSCEPVVGFVLDDSDCDDTDWAVNPIATEYCNLRDDDCDGVADEPDSIDASWWYQDGDGDGFGATGLATAACRAPTGYVAVAGDCDDTTRATYPGATEYCDGQDNNCNDLGDDEEATDSLTFHQDADGDGYGDPTVTVTACSPPAGYVDDDSDCNDSSASIHPAASETCDASNVDEDCDGLSDDLDAGAIGTTTWYRDADADSYGNASVAVSRCDLPSGYVSNDDDCDDGTASAYPGKTETCDGIDNDCDASVDEAGASGCKTYYYDYDADKYGLSSKTQCLCASSGYYTATAGSDCNDTSSAINPGKSETVGDSIDQNCDGKETCYDDDDNDGYLDTTGDTRASSDSDCSDNYEGTASDATTDCNDSDASINPSARETTGDGVDYNCDGKETCYADADNDGYRVSTTVSSSDKDCTDSGEAYSSDPSGDCNDGNSARYPGAHYPYTPPTITDEAAVWVSSGYGDRDFGGDGPKVWCYIDIDADPEDLEYNVDCYWKETSADWSYGTWSSGWTTIREPGDACEYDYIVDNTGARHNADHLGDYVEETITYTDTDKDDVDTVYGKIAVNYAQFVGDTTGNDLDGGSELHRMYFEPITYYYE